MAVPKKAKWSADAHTLAKHELLRRYLEVWFPILASRYDRLVCIDGFCGPGRYSGGEPGSPLVALEVVRTHTARLSVPLWFCFSDNEQDRIDHLQRELDEFDIPPNVKTCVRCGEFHEVLPEFISITGMAKNAAPTFAFVDPFGFKGVPFAAIRDILKASGMRGAGEFHGRCGEPLGGARSGRPSR